ncbi:MAG: M23 family metallopeptidase [Novosphingobium sp.]
MRRALALPLLAALLIAAGPEAGRDPAEEAMHTVKAGETLGGVASRAVVPRVLIIEANGLKPPYKLHAGQQLVIPRRRSVTVKPGDTGFGIAYDAGVPWSAIATANGLDPKAPLKSGKVLVIPTLSKLPVDAVTPAPEAAPAPAPRSTPIPRPSIGDPATGDDAPIFTWPAPGEILRPYTRRGAKSAHDGIDIAGAEGSAVRAARAGRVTFAGMESHRFGNLVVIDHGKGWHTAYAKLQKVTVRLGDKVRMGERVGLLGHTGETPRTELHFELRRDGRPVDPEAYLPQDRPR